MWNMAQAKLCFTFPNTLGRKYIQLSVQGSQWCSESFSHHSWWRPESIFWLKSPNLFSACSSSITTVQLCMQQVRGRGKIESTKTGKRKSHWNKNYYTEMSKKNWFCYIISGGFLDLLFFFVCECVCLNWHFCLTWRKNSLNFLLVLVFCLPKYYFFYADCKWKKIKQRKKWENYLKVSC